MSTSLVHLLTVVGKGGEHSEAICEELLGRKIQNPPKGHGTSVWSDSDQKDIDKFCVSLVRASRHLPVVYYAQYMDCWSIASSIFGRLDWPDGKKRVIYGANFNLAFYPSTHSPEFLAQIKKRRRTKLYRNQVEDRWYLDHLKDAIESALFLEAKFVVVAIDEVLEPSRHHEDFVAALETPIEL